MNEGSWRRVVLSILLVCRRSALDHPAVCHIRHQAIW